MTRWMTLWALVLAALIAAGCGAGQLNVNDDDDMSGDDDDDSAGDDDDVADDDDAVGDDDDAVGDDDDAVGDDDDAVGDDDDVSDDDDDVPQVECGPYQAPPPGQGGRVFSGEGVLEINNDWWWVGCEVERRFDPDGSLDCEIVWEVQGYYYDWDAGDWTARYELAFEADHGGSTCAIQPDEEHQTWYYIASFDWNQDEMELGYTTNPWGNGQFWAVADIEDQGNHAPFSYVTDLWES